MHGSGWQAQLAAAAQESRAARPTMKRGLACHESLRVAIGGAAAGLAGGAASSLASRAELRRERAGLGKSVLHIGGGYGDLGIEVGDPARTSADDERGHDILLAWRLHDGEEVVFAEGE